MHCVVVVCPESMTVYGDATSFKATEERTTRREPQGNLLIGISWQFLVSKELIHLHYAFDRFFNSK